MNNFAILDAMTDISSEYILSAQKRLDLCWNADRRRARRISTRRILTLAAAVMLIAVSLFMTAMAASGDFRQRVFEFLNISQTEVVPGFDPVPSGTDSKDTEPEETQMSVVPQKMQLGDILEGTYIRTPWQSHGRNGIFLICTDEQEMNQGNHYDAYAEADGELVRLEEHTFSQDYTILDSKIHVEFEWVEHNGNVTFTYIDPETPVFKQNLAGDAASTLMTFPCMSTDFEGEPINTSYPMLVNVRTGELTDVLKGTGAEHIPGIYMAAITEDLGKMLICSWMGSNYTLYYADLVTKELYSLDELSGERVDKCCLRGNTLICWTQNSVTGSVRVWNFDLTTMERRDIYSGRPIFIQGFSKTSYYGNMHLGVSFVLEKNALNEVYAVSLVDGERYLIEGLTYSDDLQFSASADGNKVIVKPRRGESCYPFVGVVNLQNKQYITFSRENMNGVTEQDIYWLDNESIIITTHPEEMSREYYVYKFSN